VKRGKRKRKRKKINDSWLNGPGGFRPKPSVAARGHAGKPAQHGSLVGHDVEMPLWARAHVPANGRGRQRQGGSGYLATEENWSPAGLTVVLRC
jgi:hypothetical protein